VPTLVCISTIDGCVTVAAETEAILADASNNEAKILRILNSPKFNLKMKKTRLNRAF
jgi:hypothetical protein